MAHWYFVCLTRCVPNVCGRPNIVGHRYYPKSARTTTHTTATYRSTTPHVPATIYPAIPCHQIHRNLPHYNPTCTRNRICSHTLNHTSTSTPQYDLLQYPQPHMQYKCYHTSTATIPYPQLYLLPYLLLYLYRNHTRWAVIPHLLP